ncbi:MAG: hypothetical protein ABEJ58_07305 [Halodesulfurarchaeum sp.]
MTEHRLSSVVDRYVSDAPGLEGHCERCLRTERWDGNAVLMVVDAAFMSVGLDYFRSVVPNVLAFEEEFVRDGPIRSFSDLRDVPIESVEHVWANERSWDVARSVAATLDDRGTDRGLSDRDSLRDWAESSSLEGWERDPIGGISGIGINTYQYLQMMGGVDTAMPDTIVRRVVRKVLAEASVTLPTGGDVELVRTIEEIADRTGYRPIEICWMTWLVESDGEDVRTGEYAGVLERI